MTQDAECNNIYCTRHYGLTLLCSSPNVKGRPMSKYNSPTWADACIDLWGSTYSRKQRTIPKNKKTAFSMLISPHAGVEKAKKKRAMRYLFFIQPVDYSCTTVIVRTPQHAVVSQTSIRQRVPSACSWYGLWPEVRSV